VIACSILKIKREQMGVGDGKRIIVVGAGLAGSLMACYLARMGYSVEVYERRSDPRQQGFVGGRSINLALSARGLAGLRGAGLEETVMKNDAIPMHGRMIHPVHGHLVYQSYSVNSSDAINSVSRGGLNITLLNAAEAYPNVKIFFDHMCLDVDLTRPSITFQTEKGVVSATADLIIAADGAFSAVRLAMQKSDRFTFSQTYLESGYKELHIPAAAQVGVDTAKYGGFAMDPNALHIWPRGGSMMIALPNRDLTFTCTLFWPFSGRHSFESLRTADEIRSFFQAQYPDVVPLMPTLAEDFLRNPASSLATMRCYPWHVHHKVVLVGDAAHAVVPFYGQGMNCAFEDCLVLAQALERTKSDFARALDFYQVCVALRSDCCAAIADVVCVCVSVWYRSSAR
jgi:kynurenine 3-monooxygenase